MIAHQRGAQRGWVGFESDCDNRVQEVRVGSDSVEAIGQAFSGTAPAIDPTGKTLAFMKSSDIGEECPVPARLVRRDVATGAEREMSVAPTYRAVQTLTWSEGGRQLAAIAFKPDGSEGIFVLSNPATSIAQAERVVTPNLPEGHRINAIAWLGPNLIANVVCCGDYPDELGVFNARTGAKLFTPPRLCAPQRGFVGAGPEGASVTSSLAAPDCRVLRLAADHTGQHVLMVDQDGNVSTWASARTAAVPRANDRARVTAVAW